MGHTYYYTLIIKDISLIGVSHKTVTFTIINY